MTDQPVAQPTIKDHRQQHQILVGGANAESLGALAAQALFFFAQLALFDPLALLSLGDVGALLTAQLFEQFAAKPFAGDEQTQVRSTVWADSIGSHSARM